MSAFTAFLVPYYWHHYGALHFLWLSDVALFLTVVALWRGSRLIVSMMAVGVLPLELYWNVDFFVPLLTGIEFAGIADYMFEAERPLLLRAVSLFHVALPIIWITYLLRWRYDPRALGAQTMLLWAVVLATYAFTDPAANINWVFAPQSMGWERLPQLAWLVLFMSVVPVAIHLPLHKLYARYLRA